MINNEQKIIQQVYAAKEDSQMADKIILEYMPFIKSETAKFLNSTMVSDYDDHLSIAMIAFHEAITNYSRIRGTFLKYATLLIRNRLIDYQRKERRHQNIISLDTSLEEDSPPLKDTLAQSKQEDELFDTKDATRYEIAELTHQMQDFGVSLTDVADNCPKQKRTLTACQKALQYAQANPAILEDLLRTKRLPIAQLCAGSGIERKTLERHRKYMVALLLIYTNGYEIIRGHLKQVMKGVTT